MSTSYRTSVLSTNGTPYTLHCLDQLVEAFDDLDVVIIFVVLRATQSLGDHGGQTFESLTMFCDALLAVEPNEGLQILKRVAPVDLAERAWPYFEGPDDGFFEAESSDPVGEDANAS